MPGLKCVVLNMVVSKNPSLPFQFSKEKRANIKYINMFLKEKHKTVENCNEKLQTEFSVTKGRCSWFEMPGTVKL